MGKSLNPHIENSREKTTRAEEEKIDRGTEGAVGPARPSAEEPPTVGSGTAIVHVLVEQQTHFLPVALYGAFRDSAQLRDFGE